MDGADEKPLEEERNYRPLKFFDPLDRLSLTASLSVCEHRQPFYPFDWLPYSDFRACLVCD